MPTTPPSSSPSPTTTRTTCSRRPAARSNPQARRVPPAASTVFVYGYDAQGRQSALSRPNQTSDTESFNDINQPLNLTTTGPGGTTLAKGTNTLDPANGQITQMT